MDFVSTNEHSSTMHWHDPDLYGSFWQIEIKSIYQICLTFCLEMPLGFNKDDLLEINCLLLGTKYTTYRLILENRESVSKLNDTHIDDFFNRCERKLPRSRQDKRTVHFFQDHD